MSSPGMYCRCSAKSIELPRCGDRCSPPRNPSTTVRATSSRSPILARTAGSRNWMPGRALEDIWSETTLWHRDRFDELRDDLVGRHTLRLRVEVEQNAMPEHRMREGANVIEADVIPPVH